MRAPDELATELHRPPVVDGDLLDAASDTIAGLQDEDVRASEREIPRRGESREARSDNDDVGHAVDRLVVREDSQRIGG